MPINRELMKMAAGRAQLEKSAIVPPQSAMQDPAAMGAAPPQDPAAAGAAPPQDPAAMGGAPAMPPPTDPSMMGGLPPAMPAPAATEQPAQQKLKPEQMMQMIDFRMYNMQQILTAIANSLGVQIDPSVLVLPPGTTGAPPAETALPGGAMAPQPQPTAPQAPAPADPAKQAADLWARVEQFNTTRIGTPIATKWQSQPEPISHSVQEPLHVKAAAAYELQKIRNER